MAELRWNPMLGTWTMVASNRQGRPHLPKNWCPFCPGSGRVPDNYDVLLYPNDFPALRTDPEMPDDVTGNDGLYKTAENYGKCEVILYSPEHTVTVPELSVQHLTKLVELWTERFIEHSKDKKIKYIFEFENRGEEVGVTMPHPHGQLYAYSWVPQKIAVELDNSRKHYQEKGSCLFCDMNKAEMEYQERIIAENESFIAYIPFFTDYPYGVFITSRRHLGALPEFNEQEKRDLASMLKNISGAFDTMFDKLFPYMMCIHQTPVNSEEYADAHEYYHFHIEFYPPLREANKIKYYASSEMGAWAACNPVAVEDCAVNLRTAYKKFVDGEIQNDCNSKTV